MHAHKVRVHIPSGDHRVSIDLPADFPSGEAEVIVLAQARLAAVPANPVSTRPAPDFSSWLASLLDRLPAAPALPDLAFDRSSIYED